MAFEFLLWNCIAPGKTSVTESGKQAVLKPQNDECVLAFRIDTNGFREHFGLVGRKACDALFFCKSGVGHPQVVLVELKGNDTETAVEQLRSTLTALRTKMDKSSLNSCGFHAIIITTGTAPTRVETFKREFKDKYKARLAVTRKSDLRLELNAK